MHSVEHELTAAHREQIEQMLRATESLNAEEVAVALELVDLSLEDPSGSDYRFLLARGPGGLAGYLCYGPTPMTEGTYDLYWLVTHPDQRRQGVARTLVVAMEQRLRSIGARLVRVETSSQEGYGAARRFYRACAYDETAVLREFYRPGDDLIIFTKALGRTEPQQPAGEAGEDPEDAGFEAVYDLAFSYRDFELERDFLRACARTHGRGEPTRVLEWACGPSRHLQSFATLANVDCVGVDFSAAMVDLARRRLGSERVQIERGNMRDHVVSPPVDLAFTMLSSIHYLTGLADLRAHLRTCAESLRPGGVYVIDATHPRDLAPGGAASTSWVQRRGDVSVTGNFSLDLAARVGEQVPSTLELTYVRGAREARGASERAYRVKADFTVPSLEQWQALVAEVPELELVATYGDFDLHTPASSVTAWRLILALRRA